MQHRRGLLLLPQQNFRWNSGQLHQFLARHPKILCEDRGSDKASRPLVAEPLLAVEHRFLPYVLQVGDLSVTEAIFDEDLPATVRHLPLILEQLLLAVPVHLGSRDSEVL